MERSSPSRTMGVAARQVVLGGVTYTLSQPDKVRKAADEEAVVLSRRLDMLPAIIRACDAVPEESRQAWRREYINAMLCGIATPEEWATYFRSLWKMAFQLWCAMDPADKVGENGKPRSLLDGVAWCYEIIAAQATTDELDSLALAIRIVSQEDAIKNSSGSAGAAPTPPMDSLTLVDGQPS